MPKGGCASIYSSRPLRQVGSQDRIEILNLETGERAHLLSASITLTNQSGYDVVPFWQGHRVIGEQWVAFGVSSMFVAENLSMGIPSWYDALDPGPDTRFDTLNRRTLPGRGNLDLVGFMSVCDEIGLEGVVSIEVMNAELRQLEVDVYARQVASTTLEVLGRVEAARPSDE